MKRACLARIDSEINHTRHLRGTIVRGLPAQKVN